MRACPVDVISVCNAQGEIRPLRVQMQDEEHQLLRINIDEIVGSKEITHVGAEAHIFTCRATVMESQWLFELKYEIRSHSWKILGRIH